MNMTMLQKALVMAALLSSNAACSPPEISNSLYMSGRIREPFVKKLISTNKPFAKIVLSSQGGLPSQSMIAVQSIIENKNSVIIEGVCLSACPEYLLPVARTVEFRDSPLIGFHWNAMMIEYLMRQNASYNLELCTFSNSRELKQLQKRSEVNTEFWKEVMQKLGKSYFAVDYKPNVCPWKVMSFENHMWLPTSTQLREQYQLQFKGTVCADHFEKCKSKIDRRWEKGTRIVVGDQVYISKGRKK